MSILKVIFHRYNSQSKSYDTMHPETEVAQITDFGNGVVNTLIGTALASTISAVTSNSVFGKCVQLVLNASGVKYSMAQNGYICLGSFFGGLIVQWGNFVGMEIDAVVRKISFNIAMNYIWSDVSINSGDIPDIVIVPYIQSADTTGLQVLIDYETGKQYTPGTSTANILWIAIGR